MSASAVKIKKINECVHIIDEVCGYFPGKDVYFRNNFVFTRLTKLFRQVLFDWELLK
jgi:hypothetical protein